MDAAHIRIGKLGEAVARNHLIRKGFVHRESNFRAKTGEIDLIMEKDRVVHFVEVKSVSRGTYGVGKSSDVSRGTYRPEDNVHPYKLRKLYRTIEVWLLLRHYEGIWQVDVASVVLDTSNRTATIRLIPNVVGS